MIPATWLALMLALAAYAWFAYRTPYVLPILAVVTAFAIWVPTGTPRITTPPAGDYQVLGADIVVPAGNDPGAIYALLKPATGPAVYYRLPYSTSAANSLQAAMDGEGGASAKVDGEGGVAYDGEQPVTGDEAKVPEVPALNIGG